MILKKNGQGSSEFLILVAGLIVFLIGFFIVLGDNIQERFQTENTINIQKIAEQVQKEVYLAQKASDGYQRVFTLPEKIINRDYIITVAEKQVYLKTLDEKYAISLPVSDLYGEIKIGENLIKKKDGVIYLNYG
jgi:hypothetical protein